MILLIFRWYVLFLLFFFWCHLGVVLWYGNNILCNILRVFGVYFVVTFWVNMLANNTVYCIITICFFVVVVVVVVVVISRFLATSRIDVSMQEEPWSTRRRAS